MSWILLCVLMTFSLWAPGLPLMTKRFVRALGMYSILAFGVRPLYLLIVNPRPTLGQRIATPLLLTPTYWDGIQTTAGLVVVGFAVTLITIYAGTRFFGMRLRPALITRDVSPVLWTIWGLAWASRLMIVSHFVEQNSAVGLIAARMLPVGIAVLGFALVKTDWRHDRNIRQLVIIAAIGEVVWAILDASKTPILAGVLFFYIDPMRSRISVRTLIITAGGVIGSFSVVQGLKQGFEATGRSATPLWQAVVENVIARFDMLNAVALAHRAGPGSYMSWGEAARGALTDWIPQQLVGVSRVSDGQQWAMVMQHTSGVALATGPVAEGYAIGGFPGIVVFGAIAGAAFVVTIWLLQASRGFTFGILVTYVVASGVLFEQGALGVIDAVSGGLQACIVVAAVALLLQRPKTTVMQPVPVRHSRAL
jgi:hypothetical protein